MLESGVENTLNDREMRQVQACIGYKNEYSDSGLPGHSTMIIIAKLWEQLQALSQAFAIQRIENHGMVQIIANVTNATPETVIEMTRASLTQALEEANANMENKTDE
jgi:hypothetical protein